MKRSRFTEEQLAFALRQAEPRTLAAGQPGHRSPIEIDLHYGRQHLPIVSLKRAA